PLATVILGTVSVLFLLVAFYVPGYLELRPERDNRIFCGVLLFFLAMTSLLTLAQHLGLLWVAMEATTLATAPLLYFNRTARSLEATWKYLMIGSVGIAIALLGSLFLAYSAYLGGGEPSLLFDDLLAGAGSFSRPWLRAAFVLLLVGYGTKMGLAPLHTWKPDAYGEAPGLVGALLAGGMTNCAFLALLRVYRVVNAAGEGAFARELLVFMGLASIGLAAVFVVRQRDIKRMLAYSSVEHVGILILGIGLGGIGVFGALLAGGMTNCAFLALLRVYRVVNAAGEGAFARELLIFMGLVSIGLAAVFVVRQRDIKRMLAYSSVEHVGILILGIGLGGIGVFGALLHAINNGLTKGILFLAAGNIQRAYGSKSTDEISGAISRLPISGSLFLVGFFAITGSPPFGPFVSEFTIVNAAIGGGHPVAGTLFLVLLGIIFIGMGSTVLSAVQGRPGTASAGTPYKDDLARTAPILVAAALVLFLGLYLPAPLVSLLERASAGLEALP
ncbi:MAG TPA: proton-conducting transporter membrane subunit, partial [Thermoanaerobaculia bacterium]|nr:proton-conducting transporter membrane subunit [Thermoanaerobaculia bacterium]